MARASACDISGATSHSCEVTRAIQNVHDQPELLRRRPALVNLLRPVEFKTIPQPQILDAWYQWRNTGRVFVSRDFLSIFGRLCDVLVRVSASDSHHRTLRKNPYEVRDYDFRVQASFNGQTSQCETLLPKLIPESVVTFSVISAYIRSRAFFQLQTLK